MRLFAVVPAAGLSTRMGQPKLSLLLGGRPVLERVVETLLQGGVDRCLVVVGPHVPELVPLAEQAGGAVCLLADPTPDMRATVEAGLAWLEKQEQPGEEDAWLLVPADHPALVAEVVRQLREAYRPTPGGSLIVPTHGGKRGHPLLLAWSLVEAIRAQPRGLGLNSFLREKREITREIEVAFPQILWDLDTPEDFRRLAEALGLGQPEGKAPGPFH